MKWLYIFFSAVVLFATVLILDQIWFNIVDGKTFWKLLITDGIIGGLALAVYLLRSEFIEDRKMKKDKFVD